MIRCPKCRSEDVTCTTDKAKREHTHACSSCGHSMTWLETRR